MADNLKDLAKSLILERCKLSDGWPLDFKATNPLFIPIKDNQVSLSKEIESLEDADACMLFFTYFRDNTVPDKYKKDSMVTFRNSYRDFAYIDSQGKSSYHFYDDKFEINGFSNGNCRLEYDDTKLMNVYVTEDSIKELWNCYQIAKKCVAITQIGIEEERSEMTNKIDTLTTQLNDLNAKYKEVADSIKAIADTIDEV